MSSYYDRNHWHELARPIVAAQFHERGFLTFDHGAEFAEGLSPEVRKQDDRCSLMLRFRPDIITVLPECRSALCEIKATPPDKKWDTYHTALIEARSYMALREWNVGGNVALLAFHVFPENYRQYSGETFATWLSDVPEPKSVTVYRRHDFERQCRDMQMLLPHARIEVRDWRGGSGTPSIHIPKRCLKPLGEFIDADIIGFGRDSLRAAGGWQ